MLALYKASNYLIMRSFRRPNGLLGMTLFGFLEVFPDQPVLPSTLASETVVQTTAALAHPPYLPGRNAGHQGVIFHILGHNGTGGDQGAAPYRMTAHYRAIRAQRCALAHARTRVNSVHREVRPRSIYIREYAGRTTEDIVFDFDALVYGNIVLDADTIPDVDIVTHIHILTQGTVRSDNSPTLNMTEMPNFSSGADLDTVIHVTALVNEKVLHSSVSPSDLSNHSRGHDPGYDGLNQYVYNDLLLDGGDHDAAAEFLHVVEHVVHTALIILDQLVRIHTELVHERVVHGIRTVLGEHHVVRRGSSLLVSITTDEVADTRSALDEVGNSVDVDEFLLGDVPTVDDEVDVEPHLRNDGLRSGDIAIDGIDTVVDDGLLVVVVHAHTLGIAPSAGFLTDVPGETEGAAEDTVHLAVDQPVLLIGLVSAALTVEVVTDEGAAEIEHEAELIVQAELVDQTGIESSGREEAILGEAHDDTTTGISVNAEETVGLETAEDVHQVGVGKGIDIQETTLLKSNLLIGTVTQLRIEIGESLIGLETGKIIDAVCGTTLIQALKTTTGDTETDTETRGGPLGQVSVDGREGEHVELVTDLPVILTIIEFRAKAEVQLPVVPETVGEHGSLINGSGREHIAVLRQSLLLDDDLVIIFLAVHSGALCENTCRREERDRSNHKK